LGKVWEYPASGFFRSVERRRLHAGDSLGPNRVANMPLFIAEEFRFLPEEDGSYSRDASVAN